MSEISSHLESSQVPLGLAIKANLQESQVSSMNQRGPHSVNAAPPFQAPEDRQVTLQQQAISQDPVTPSSITGSTVRTSELPGTIRLGVKTKSGARNSWLRTQARAAWVSSSSYKMLEWGASAVSPGICVIVPQCWGDKSPREVVQTLNLARFVEGATTLAELVREEPIASPYVYTNSVCRVTLTMLSRSRGPLPPCGLHGWMKMAHFLARKKSFGV
jgi:hypothetical protein